MPLCDCICKPHVLTFVAITHLPDLAYDEHKDGSLEVVLNSMGYNLIKHDKTAVPGYLGHYIALSSKEKVAVIGVKGTSNVEDFFTDVCAAAVQYNLPNDGGSLTCHEGIYISSERLHKQILPTVRDLLIPSGYKIVVVGHSLGAGCGTILSMLLRASIPVLRDDSDKLKVWAFASPPILDYKTALACKSHVTTVVNNADAVPRGSISPLVVTTKVLRAVDKRMKEQGLDLSSFKSTIAFMNKMKEGKDGEMLMSVDEIEKEWDTALEETDLNDSDYLYVPGNVVMMYNLWEQQEDVVQEEQDNEKKDMYTLIKEWIQRVEDTDMHSGDNDINDYSTTAVEAVLCDGTCKALRFIELDDRLLDDHMAPAYRESIRNLLC